MTYGSILKFAATTTKKMIPFVGAFGLVFQNNVKKHSIKLTLLRCYNEGQCEFHVKYV